MSVLHILVRILNAGIDYDRSRGDFKSASEKIKARDKILEQALK